MPKYKLDEKGILTIVSEHDNGIFSFAHVMKIITSILIVFSIVSSIGIYSFFYANKETSSYAAKQCEKYISENVICEKDGDLIVKLYAVKPIKKKVKSQALSYSDYYDSLINNGKKLIENIAEQINNKKNEWG